MKTLFITFLYVATVAAMLLPQFSHAQDNEMILDKPAQKVGRTVKSSRNKTAAKMAAVTNQSTAENGKPKLSTTMAFSGSRVGGQYQVPSEATAQIENEKPIEELLGLRTQFRDRMKQDEERK